jgi:hypothetical protein
VAVALSEHALSADFATRIAALCGRAARGSCGSVLRETLKKTAFSQQPIEKSACESARMCYFPAAIRSARLQRPRFPQNQFLEE